MELDALDHVGLLVSDIDRSIEWYERVLGLQRAYEHISGCFRLSARKFPPKMPRPGRSQHENHQLRQLPASLLAYVAYKITRLIGDV